MTAYLPISRFGGTFLPPGAPRKIINGGVDNSLLTAEEVSKRGYALFVGRLLPHKGINYIIDGLRDDIELVIVGRPHDPGYFELLTSLAQGKNVRFVLDANDHGSTLLP